MFSRKKENGFTLVELTIAVLLSGLLAGGYIYHRSMEYKRQRGAALGDQVHVINEAVSSYITKNYGALVSAVPVVAGFAAPLQPTTAELRTAGILRAEVSDTNICGTGYTIVISKLPSGCVSPNCDLQSQTMTSGPVLHSGTATVDTITLAAAANKIGGNAGVAVTAATFEGLGGAWTATNPLATAGILTEKFSYASSDLAGFLKTDGTNQMLAALNVGGNDVNSARHVNASGTVSGGTVNSSGNMTAAGTVTGGTVNSTGNMSAAGQVSVGANNRLLGNGSQGSYGATTIAGQKNGWTGTEFRDSSGNYQINQMTNRSNIGYYDAASGRWLNYTDTSGNMTLDQTADFSSGKLNPGWAVETWGCSPNGAIAKAAYDTTNGWAYSGLLLSCQSGVWAKVSGSSSGLGIGQTWANLTGSRSLSTTYTNSTGKPIQVVVSGIGHGNGVYAVVSGVTFTIMSGYSGSTYMSGSFIVPTGATYSVVPSISFTKNSWFELR